jgi:hypothetical protein
MRPFALEIVAGDFAVAVGHRRIAGRGERDSRPVISVLDGRPFLVLLLPWMGRPRAELNRF